MQAKMATACLILVAYWAPAASEADGVPACPALSLAVMSEGADVSRAEVLAGLLDARFEALPGAMPGVATPGVATPGVATRGLVPRARRGAYWLKITSVDCPGGPATPGPEIPVVLIHALRQAHIQLWAEREPGMALSAAELAPVTALAAFRNFQDRVYAVPGLAAGKLLYARIVSPDDSERLRVTAGSLQDALARGAEHARIIDWVVGALVAMAAAALFIWFVLAEKLFVLYFLLFFLQALYIGFLSGQAFDWPLLVLVRPLTSFAWNVPVGLSGAAACLFTREIADLRDFSPRSFAAFGGFAVAFVVVTVANVAKLAGFGPVVNAIGNLVFFVAAVFTLTVAFLSWRRGNRAAGWFLIAWTLLEGSTIAAAVRFLAASDQDDPILYYYCLPLSMAAAAVLIALGVADRLRQQRAALSDAERRAQTDPLTGVLNRRSLIERLDAASARARARGLAISLLFIDLDHFKLINDSFGHQAGDACLRAIIGPIQAELRQSDVIGRYGGEEFVVILSDADAFAARPIAERILARVADVRVDGFGETIKLTCSIGVAASDVCAVWGEQLIAQADVAVYAAKHRGRNQVQLAMAVV